LYLSAAATRKQQQQQSRSHALYVGRGLKTRKTRKKKLLPQIKNKRSKVCLKTPVI